MSICIQPRAAHHPVSLSQTSVTRQRFARDGRRRLREILQGLGFGIGKRADDQVAAWRGGEPGVVMAGRAGGGPARSTWATSVTPGAPLTRRALSIWQEPGPESTSWRRKSSTGILEDR